MTAAPAVDDTVCDNCASASLTVIVPCHNEVATVAGVVEGFRAALPTAQIIVADNRSDDGTGEAALRAGAAVVRVPIAGKGRAVRRLLELCTSDAVIMVDGDLTYDPSVAGRLRHLVYCEGYDLVNVSRLDPPKTERTGGEYRIGHRLGNQFLTGLQQLLTGIRLSDILTGYKAMSRRFVTSFPVRSRGFSLEVEIAAHAVAMDFAYTEIPAPYVARPEGSVSKLATYRDGFAILRMLLRLHRDLHPFAAFGILSVPWFLGSIALATGPLVDYFSTGMVPRYPSLIAAGAAFVVAMLLLMSGWLLDRTSRMRRDLLQLTANDMERSTVLGRASLRDVTPAGVVLPQDR